MKLIDVIPLSRGIGKETLSYFTLAEISPGAVVLVPLRSKKISALVVRVEDAALAKAEIKNADFAIKKVDAVKTAQLFSPEFVRAAQDTARYFAATTGSVLGALVPGPVLKRAGGLELPSQETKQGKKNPEKWVIQGEDEERFASYRSRIRQEFAQKHSVFFCVPTIEDAKRSQKLLEKGIEDYTFVLHSGLREKEILSLWKKTAEEKHPVVIIGTPSFISLPRGDLSTIIIEKENSRNYKIPSRPYFDIRYFLERYAEASGAQLFLGDTLLRIETLWREEEGEVSRGTPFKFRSLSTSKETLVDMRAYKAGENGFKIISPEVEGLIKDTKANNDRLFILTSRRGVAPTTLCADCQNIVMCENCSSPVVLHSKKKGGEEKNYFLCHRCGEGRSADEVCKTCGSWKLATVGIGIELVEEKIRQRFPDIRVFRLDSDTVKTEKELSGTLASFYAAPGSILIGTEMALLYLYEKVENSAIISIDSLFSIPDFRIHEKILYTLLKMRHLTSRSFVLQTRNPEEKVLEYALKGNLIDFYRNEIASRKSLAYPPFSVLIKITLEGERDAIAKEMQAMKEMFEPFALDVFPAFTETVKGKALLHSLIRIERGKWPDADLLAKLSVLPPYVMIKVDPESLL